MVDNDIMSDVNNNMFTTNQGATMSVRSSSAPNPHYLLVNYILLINTILSMLYLK